MLPIDEMDISKIKVGDQVVVSPNIYEGMDAPWGVTEAMLMWKGCTLTVESISEEVVRVRENVWGWSLPMLEAHIPQIPPQIMRLDF